MTAAGMVFAVTMSLFVFSDLRIIGQIGTTIGLGLLFDTLVVRSFMTPSIAALLGRWFWWPLRCARARPVRCFGRSRRADWFAPCCCRPASTRQRLAPMSRPQVELLTRAGCAICVRVAEQLAELSSELGFDMMTIDVDVAASTGNPGLRAEFGDRLPVVLLDGREHSYWEVDEHRLRADIARSTFGSPPDKRLP